MAPRSRGSLGRWLAGLVLVPAAGILAGELLVAAPATASQPLTLPLRRPPAPPVTASKYPSPHLAAPYLQVDEQDVRDMTADMNATGLKDYTLAFLTPVSASSCTGMWEDGSYPMNTFVGAVHSLQAAGGDVIVSFGGADGGDLGKSCTSVSKLEAAYAGVAAAYGVTRLDFDVEGSILSDTTATSRRNLALAELQKAHPAVQVDFTLPVNPTGLPAQAVALLRQAVADGVEVDFVNIMTMDFGDGQNVLADAESAGVATERQLAKIYPSRTPSQIWELIGMTPIAGKNDDAEDFTIADARTLESWAAAKGVGLLSFWEVDEYDKPAGYRYSAIFDKITS